MPLNLLMLHGRGFAMDCPRNLSRSSSALHSMQLAKSSEKRTPKICSAKFSARFASENESSALRKNSSSALVSTRCRDSASHRDGDAETRAAAVDPDVRRMRRNQQAARSFRPEISKSNRPCRWLRQKRDRTAGVGSAWFRLRGGRDDHRTSATGQSAPAYFSLSAATRVDQPNGFQQRRRECDWHASAKSARLRPLAENSGRNQSR